MKKYIYMMLFIATNAMAQNVCIKGTVADKETGKPLEDVVVSIQKTNSRAHTDAAGKFILLGVKEGVHDVDFNKIGCERKNISFTVAENETKTLDVELTFASLSLSSVNVSADRPVSAASSKYIRAIDFENRPKNSAQDMLRLVPGLFIAQHAGGGKAEQIFIRGFDCDHGTDVASFVDGIPVNLPSHGHGQGYMDLHFLIPETVERMEIFKGPYSPKFGNFATGAAVQFNTLDSLSYNLIQLESGFTSGTGGLTASRGLAMLQLPQLTSNVNSYFAADVINNRGYFESPQDFKRVSLFSKTTFSISDNSHLHLSVGGFGSSWNASGQIPERAVKSGLISRFGSIDDTEGGTTQRNNFNLTYHTQLELTEFEVQAYTSTYRFKLYSNFTFYLEDHVNGDMIEQDDNRTIKGLNVRYTIGHKLGKMQNKFSISTSFRADDIENQLWIAPNRTRNVAIANALVQERSTSVYANEVFRFNDQFRVELGGRFDYFIFDVEDLLPTDSLHENYSGFNYQTLLSPKININYIPTQRLQFFINGGTGFHSNDARSSVQEPTQHELPLSVGAELGSIIHVAKNFVASAALWRIDIENELVYEGDDGTTENKGSSRRTGIDISARLQITKWLFADADLNMSKGVLTDKIYGEELTEGKNIPLAPTATSTGGFTAKFKNGFETGLRYRYINDRPANEANTVTAEGYNVIDFAANYKTRNLKIGLTIENLLNTKWNEAQFDTESRLFNEIEPVSELHYTPGTPFAAKLTIGYIF